MKLSARNVLVGQVSEVSQGAVNALVRLTLKNGNDVFASITNASVEELGLEGGKEAFAIVKASSVIVGADLHQAKVSARNLLCGEVCKVVDGPINAEIHINVGPGVAISAVITHESAKVLDLQIGDHACAMFKASSVILGVN
ncbi:TOBE domain-containing protein [Holophaga foetida]|uniref:TOBE domain-containing protein n=1 Tax=Holophaga foetida TaxID=35839 RepID=UPI0002473F03|nr:TOBE domain-containing protein [Holophaga foetida]